jgi:hypothetical protein
MVNKVADDGAEFMEIDQEEIADIVPKGSMVGNI